jgi:hypothetical protein
MTKLLPLQKYQRIVKKNTHIKTTIRIAIGLSIIAREKSRLRDRENRVASELVAIIISY